MNGAIDQPVEADSSLIRRLNNGETDAFDVLFQRHRKGLFAYVRGMVTDRGLAEDIVQECFLELARHAVEIRPEQGVTGWLYRVGRNRAIDMLRARRPEAARADRALTDEPGDQDIADPGPTPLDHAIARGEIENVRRALDMLSPKDRDILLLRYFGDLKFSEIAGLRKRPLGTVLWQATRSLEKIRKLLAGIEEA